MTPSTRVIACPRPFSVDRVELSLEAGHTIAQILERAGMGRTPHARVFIDDRLIQEAEWLTAKPDPGQVVTLRAIPTGGGGGGKDALRIVAMIAVVALAVYSGGAAAGALGLTQTLASGAVVLTPSGLVVSAVVATAVSITGALAVNAMIPPPRQLTHRAKEISHG